jgi:hypothetical protein
MVKQRPLRGEEDQGMLYMYKESILKSTKHYLKMVVVGRQDMGVQWRVGASSKYLERYGISQWISLLLLM